MEDEGEGKEFLMCVQALKIASFINKANTYKSRARITFRMT